MTIEQGGSVVEPGEAATPPADEQDVASNLGAAADAPDASVEGDVDGEADGAVDTRGTDAPPPPDDGDLPRQVEALLFVSDGGVDEGALARALGVTRRRLDHALDALASALREGTRGVRLQRGPDGAQLVTAPESAAYIEYFLGLESSRRLSTAALETLAIIAYRHPVTRGTIESIRGVSSDAAIATLRARGLIADGGRAEGPGRPVLWVTTQRFLQHFGLERRDDLPPLPDDVDLPGEPEGEQLPLSGAGAEHDLAAFAQVAGAALAGHRDAVLDTSGGDSERAAADTATADEPAARGDGATDESQPPPA